MSGAKDGRLEEEMFPRFPEALYSRFPRSVRLGTIRVVLFATSDVAGWCYFPCSGRAELGRN